MTQDFAWALRHLKGGRKVYRQSWNGPGQWIDLQVPDSNSKMTLPYLYIFTAQGERVPWIASQSDLLCEDWEVVA
jgi:hypothetical protein